MARYDVAIVGLGAMGTAALSALARRGARVVGIERFTPWFTGSGSDFQGYFAENVQNVFLGRDKAADGWDAFMKRINTVLAMPNPV